MIEKGKCIRVCIGLALLAALSSILVVYLQKRDPILNSDKPVGPINDLGMVVKDLLPWMQDQIPLLISPGGRRLLVKNEISKGESELVITELTTGKLLGRHQDGWPLLIAWRPMSDAISFVVDDHGDRRYRLAFWEYITGEITYATAPELHSASRFMRWSPNGKYLAFCDPRKGAGQDDLKIIDVSESYAASAITVYSSPNIRDFSWSPDSGGLAITIGSSNVINIIDVKTGDAHIVAVSAESELRNIVWTSDKDVLLVTCKQVGQSVHHLRRINLKSGVSELFVSPAGANLEYPVDLPDGAFLYGSRKDGVAKLMLGGVNGEHKPVGFSTGDTIFLAADRQEGGLLIEHWGVDSPGAVYRIGLVNGTPKLIFGKANDLPVVRPERQTIPARDGLDMTIIVWKSKRQPSLGTMIKFPVNRNKKQRIKYNGTDQYIVNEGYDIVAFNYESIATDRTNKTNSTEREIIRALSADSRINLKID